MCISIIFLSFLENLINSKYNAALAIDDTIPVPLPDEAMKATIENKKLAQEIKDLCQKRFSSYKIPTHIEFWKTIPKTPSKKLLRKKVREIING